MSSRTSRKRTSAQRFGYDEGNGVDVKGEPGVTEEEEEGEGRTRGGRGRQRRAPARGGGSLQSQSHRDGQHQHQLQQIEDEDDQPPHLNPFLPLHRLNRADTGTALTQGDMKISDITLSARQQGKWDRVSDTQKAQIVKAVTRLLLLKGKLTVGK